MCLLAADDSEEGCARRCRASRALAASIVLGFLDGLGGFGFGRERRSVMLSLGWVDLKFIFSTTKYVLRPEKSLAMFKPKIR